jgi:hypothetical protein
VGLGETGGQDVEVVTADADDPAVQPGDLAAGPGVAGRAAGAARPLAAQVPQFAQRGLQRAGVRHSLEDLAVAAGDGGKNPHSYVHPDP